MSEPLTVRSVYELLDDIVGHLGAARMQLTERDDRIIADHLIAAHELARMLRRKA